MLKQNKKAAENSCRCGYSQNKTALCRRAFDLKLESCYFNPSQRLRTKDLELSYTRFGRNGEGSDQTFY